MADQNNGHRVEDPNMFICQLCKKNCDISRIVSVPCCLRGTTCLECSIQHIVKFKKCWDCDNPLTPKDIIRGSSIASHAVDMISLITKPVDVPKLKQDNQSLPAGINNTTSAVINNTSSAFINKTTTSGVINNTTLAVINNTTSAVINNTTTFIKNNTTSAVINNTTSAAINNTTSAVLNNTTTSAVINNTTSAVINNTTTPAVINNTTTPSVINNTTTSSVINNTTSANSLPQTVQAASTPPSQSPQPSRQRSWQPSDPNRIPMMVDETLPCGWYRMVKQRKAGNSKGRIDVFIIGPSGKRFKSRNQLKTFFETTGETSLKAEDFDFSTFGRSNRKIEVPSSDKILPSLNRKRVCVPTADMSEEPVSKRRNIVTTDELTATSEDMEVQSTTFITTEPTTLDLPDNNSVIKIEPGINPDVQVKKEPITEEDPINNNLVRKESSTEDQIINPDAEVKKEPLTSNIRLNEFLAMTKRERVRLSNSMDKSEFKMLTENVTLDEWLALDEKQFKHIKRAMNNRDFKEFKHKLLNDVTPEELERTKEKRFGRFMTAEEILFQDTVLEREKLVLSKYRREAVITKQRLCWHCNTIGHTTRDCLLTESLFCNHCNVPGHQRRMISCPSNNRNDSNKKIKASKIAARKEKEAWITDKLKEQMLNWAAEEPLGEEARIAMVLYTNLNHPNLKTEYPDWSHRCQQIKKIWKNLPHFKKNNYFVKAIDNLTANNVPKSQEELNLNIKELKQELEKLQQIEAAHQSATPLAAQSAAALAASLAIPLAAQSVAPLAAQSAVPLPYASAALLAAQSAVPLPDTSAALLAAQSAAPSEVERKAKQDRIKEEMNQRQMQNWAEAELLGDKATIAIVLCSNLANPNLATEFPDWQQRSKIIQNIWDSVPDDVKSFYISKAMENMKAVKNNTSNHQTPIVIQQNPGMIQLTPKISQQSPAEIQQNPGLIQSNPAVIHQVLDCLNLPELNLIAAPPYPATNPQTDEEKEQVVQYESWLEAQDAQFNQHQTNLTLEGAKLRRVRKSINRKKNSLAKEGKELEHCEVSELARIESVHKKIGKSWNTLSKLLKKHKWITGVYFLQKNNLQKDLEHSQQGLDDTTQQVKESILKDQEIEIIPDEVLEIPQQDPGVPQNEIEILQEVVGISDQDIKVI